VRGLLYSSFIFCDCAHKTAGALEIAELMRKSIEALAIPHAQSGTGNHVTISLGVASIVPMKEAPAHTIIKAADSALYAAKMSSRNCVKKAS